MTDRHDPLDDLASAHLDGETTPGEAARVGADVELLARVARLAAVRDALRGAGVAVDATQRDQTITAALAAFDEAGGHDRPAVPDLGVSPLARAAARRPPRRVLQLAGIAAALTLLALAVPLLGRLDPGSNDDLAGRSTPTSDDMALRSSEMADAAQDAAAGASPGQVAPPDLGAFPDLPGLADAVRSQLGMSGAAMESSAPAVAGTAADKAARCDDQQAVGGPPVFTALAVLDGQPVVIVVRDDPDGGRTIVVLDQQDCTTVVAGKL